MAPVGSKSGYASALEMAMAAKTIVEIFILLLKSLLSFVRFWICDNKIQRT
jgi:hypothetical protein